MFENARMRGRCRLIAVKIENSRMVRDVHTITARSGEYGAEFQKGGTGVYLVSPWRMIPFKGKRHWTLPLPVRLAMVAKAKEYFFGGAQVALPFKEVV